MAHRQPSCLTNKRVMRVMHCLNVSTFWGRVPKKFSICSNLNLCHWLQIFFSQPLLTFISWKVMVCPHPVLFLFNLAVHRFIPDCVTHKFWSLINFIVLNIICYMYNISMHYLFFSHACIFMFMFVYILVNTILVSHHLETLLHILDQCDLVTHLTWHSCLIRHFHHWPVSLTRYHRISVTTGNTTRRHLNQIKIIPKLRASISCVKLEPSTFCACKNTPYRVDRS